MGLFTQRPEHNEEWAGLPSEPVRPESAAERLPQSGAQAASVEVDGSVESIVIPIGLFVAPDAPKPAAADDERRDGI